MSRSIVIVTFIACCYLMGGCTASLNNRPPVDRAIATEAKDRGAMIARAALNVLGTPYRYGGNDSNGFDCSGLVQYAHSQAGISIPRTAEIQYKSANNEPRALQIGDVLFFKIQGKVSHNGIYLGNGRFIHAPSTGKNVSIARLENNYFKKRLIGVKRFH